MSASTDLATATDPLTALGDGAATADNPVGETTQQSPDPRAPGYDAVLLAGFGGPEGPDDVMPFLRNVTRGRGIPDERLVEVSHHYQALGGKSPINEQNRQLRAALEAELRSRGVTTPVLWGNRNWAPYLTDVVVDAAAAGQVRLLGLATSAYSSYSSCRQYREDFGRALADTGLVGRVRIDKVSPYFAVRGFVDPFVDDTAAALRSAAEAGLSPADLRVVFTTHSIPNTMADTSGSATLGDHQPGGAYVTQHLAVARTVLRGVAQQLPDTEGIGWQLVYQSRSGPPSVPWLDPDINDVIETLAGEGVKGVVVVPIGFVSDHVEVIWDLDHEAAETAQEHGLWFARVPTPGTDPRFVAALADLLLRRLDGTEPGEGALGDRVVAATPRPDFCAPACCVNARVRRPTTAAVDSARDWEGLEVGAAELIASGVPGVAAS